MSEPIKGDIIVDNQGREYQVVARSGDVELTPGTNIRYREITYSPFLDKTWEEIQGIYKIKQRGGRKTRRHHKKSHRRHKKSHRR